MGSYSSRGGRWDIKKYIEQLKVKIDQDYMIINKLDQEIIQTKDNEKFKQLIDKTLEQVEQEREGEDEEEAS